MTTIKRTINKMVFPKVSSWFSKAILKMKLLVTLEWMDNISFPGGWGVKNPLANAGDVSLIPGSGRCPGGGNGNQLQYSCLGNPTEEPGVGYCPWGCKRVRHDLAIKQQQQRDNMKENKLNKRLAFLEIRAVVDQRTRGKKVIKI